MTVTSFLISSALYASSLHYTAERENMEGNRTHCPLPSTGSPPFPSLFSTFHSTTTTITAAPLWTQGNNQPHSDTSNVPLNVSKVFFFSKPEMRAWKKKIQPGTERMQGSICTTSWCAVIPGYQTPCLTKTTGVKPLHTYHGRRLADWVSICNRHD